MKNRYNPRMIVMAVSLVFIAVGSFLTVNYYGNHLNIQKSYSDTQNNTSYLETAGCFGSVSENYSVESSTEPEETTEEKRSSHVIENFGLTLQMPELPTGCEITALTMVLNYYGCDADKMTMATEYLPISSSYFYYGDDGTLYGPDLNNYFVGDPLTTGGYICGTGAIITAANDYLEDVNSSLRAEDITGSSPEELYQLIDEDTPVVVWVTVYMTERTDVSGWYTENGEYVDWSTSDHGAVLIGYSEDTVTIADPISGIVTYDRQDFENVFESRGNKCVILK